MRAVFLLLIVLTGLLISGTAPTATTRPVRLAAPTSALQCAAGGLIGDKWRALGAERGPLGCPVGGEQPVPGGRVQTFEHGQIAWSPNQGPRMVVALYARGNETTLDWGPTLPFNYSFFIVRWNLNDRNVGQQDVANPGQASSPSLRDHGRFSTVHLTPGRYTFIVEGCDKRLLSDSSCRQGWTVPVAVAVPQAAPAPPPMPRLPPPRPAVPGPFEMDRAEFFNCTPEQRSLYFWVKDEQTNRIDQFGPISAHYDQNGRCPGAGTPFDVNFTDQHTYTIVAVDPVAIGCGANDPSIQACQKKTFILKGRTGAGTKQYYVP